MRRAHYGGDVDEQGGPQMVDPGPREPRITPVQRHDDKQVLNIFRTLSHNGPLLKSFLTLGSHLLQEGRVDPRERELVILRVGWQCAAEYEFAQHMTIGKSVGVTDEEINRLADCGEGQWSDADQALVNLADELCSDNVVSELTWSALAARFDDATLLELLMLVGFYRLVSGTLNSTGVALEPGVEGWPARSVPVRRAPRQSAP